MLRSMYYVHACYERGCNYSYLDNHGDCSVSISWLYEQLFCKGRRFSGGYSERLPGCSRYDVIPLSLFIYTLHHRFCSIWCCVVCITFSLYIDCSESRYDGKDSDDWCYLSKGVYNTWLHIIQYKVSARDGVYN